MRKSIIGISVIGIFLVGIYAAYSAPQGGISQAQFSTGPCASGYQRAAPSQCRRSVGGTTAASINTTCTTLDLASLYGIPTSARAVEVAVRLVLFTGTAAGDESVTLFFYSDSGCAIKLPTNISTSAATTDLEISAIATTTVASHILERQKAVIRLWSEGQTTVYAKKVDTIVAGGSTVAQTDGIFLYYD